MKRKKFEKVSVEKLSAYLDGTLNEQETAEMDALVDSDEELQAVVDEYLSIQFELANAKDYEKSVEMTNVAAVRSIQTVMQNISHSESRKHVKTIKRDIYRMLGAACVAIAVIFSFMVFSPTTIVDDGGDVMQISRDGYAVFGEQIDYEAELANVDSMIKATEQKLPGIEFFDRYRSEAKRKEIANRRAELYKLQWQRIFLLLQLQREEELTDALKKFVKVNGPHRKEAEELLEELNGAK